MKINREVLNLIFCVPFLVLNGCGGGDDTQIAPRAYSETQEITVSFSGTNALSQYVYCKASLQVITAENKEFVFNNLYSLGEFSDPNQSSNDTVKFKTKIGAFSVNLLDNGCDGAKNKKLDVTGFISPGPVFYGEATQIQFKYTVDGNGTVTYVGKKVLIP
ncbi:MAG: hypothetical protein EOO68_11455 [Moraxellaceae bacterium]|nr:MAG: hypothetical protein EOO68_11455 [Moraxellaceae bacterium]